jgi:rhodanese-related sulfurtransferase
VTRASDDAAVGDGRLTVGELLAAARARIERLEPHEAWAAVAAGEALLVDIRSEDDRRRWGIAPGGLHLPRTVLEWRVDPTSGWHNPHVDGHERLLLLCTDGYSSSLAAATLVTMGRERAGDVTGGFRAWRLAGLPVLEAPEREDGVLPGMHPPDPVP